jgi:hypothetical protein
MHEGDCDSRRQEAHVRVERQDLDEMLGNLVENAAKYGGRRLRHRRGNRSFVDSCSRTTARHPPKRRAEFTRGSALDTTGSRHRPRPRNRRDVAEIYGGTVSLEESEDLGGLLARLSLPMG